MGMLQLAAGWRRAVPEPLTAAHPAQLTTLVLLQLCCFSCAPVAPPELCRVCGVGGNPSAAPSRRDGSQGCFDIPLSCTEQELSASPAGDCLMAPAPCHRHW